MFETRNKNAQIVSAFYRQILGREPDADGFAAYTALIKKVGVAEGVETMLKGFLGSPEYVIKRSQSNLVEGLTIAQRKLINGKNVAHIVSLGTHCLTSSILKKWGLKKYSMPFDWLFTSPAAVVHCMEDGFRALMDRSFYGPTPMGAGAAAHTWYRENYEIPTVFAHRDPRTEDNYFYLERSVKRFNRLMQDTDSAKLFVMIADWNHDLRKSFAQLSQTIRAKASNSALIGVQLTSETGTGLPGCSSMRQITADGDHALYEFTSSSTQRGVGFPEVLDDLAVLRLIHQYDIELSPSV